MKKLTALITLVAIIASSILLAGCGNNSVIDIYYRDFGNYISSTMFVELKKDGTFEADGATDPNLPSEGTYEIDGSVVTFYFSYFWDADMGIDDLRTFTGTINGDTLTVGDIVYRKQSGNSLSAGQEQERAFREGLSVSAGTQSADKPANVPSNVSYEQLTSGALPGYDEYPWSFSIFIACVNRSLPLNWGNLKPILTDAGYTFWYPNDDETGGWMLFPNHNDEQGYYNYEFATLLGGVSDDNETVVSLMYQVNYDFDYVFVEFLSDGDRYTICEGYDIWEVDTFDELISYAINALDAEYDRMNE